MDIRPVQSCRSNDGWIPVQVASSSEQIDYTVHVCPWNQVHESICECPGYVYRGHCRHQQIAWDSICRWHQEGLYNKADGDTQTEEQRKEMTCPRCGGKTKWELTVDEK